VGVRYIKLSNRSHNGVNLRKVVILSAAKDLLKFE